MKTLTNATIAANIATAINSVAFKAALSWNLMGTRIDKAFLGGYAKVVEAGIILDFEEGDDAVLIECSKKEAYLVLSCWHNKDLFLDVLGSDIFGLDPLEEFKEPTMNTIIAVQAVETITFDEYGEVEDVSILTNLFEFKGDDLPDDIQSELPTGETLWVTFHWKSVYDAKKKKDLGDDIPF